MAEQIVRKITRFEGPVVKGAGSDEAEVWISTEDIDRDGDIVVAAGADVGNYLRNPIVLFGHNYFSAEAVVGRTIELRPRPGKGIRARWQWAPAGTSTGADTVRGLWDAGLLNAASIGFRPQDTAWIDADGNELESSNGRPVGARGRKFKRWELLEWSVVPVPANASAVRMQRSVKALDQLVQANSCSLEQLFPSRLVDRAPIIWQEAAARAGVPALVVFSKNGGEKGSATLCNGAPVVAVRLTSDPVDDVRTFLHELLHFARHPVEEYSLIGGAKMVARAAPDLIRYQDTPGRELLEQAIEAEADHLTGRVVAIARARLSRMRLANPAAMSASEWREAESGIQTDRSLLLDSIPEGLIAA